MITPTQWSQLMDAALRASRKAYCPYSDFRVGAAVLGSSGAIHGGCNVENASYGLTICAERAAVARAIAEGETELLAIVVYTPTAKPTAPCGACRQVLNEFGPDMPIRCICKGKDVIRSSMAKLLPIAFGPRNLD
jgi:cytidine deaminase